MTSNDLKPKTKYGVKFSITTDTETKETMTIPNKQNKSKFCHELEIPVEATQITFETAEIKQIIKINPKSQKIKHSETKWKSDAQKIIERMEKHLEAFDDMDCHSAEVLQHKLLNEQSLDRLLVLQGKLFHGWVELQNELLGGLEEFLEVVSELEKSDRSAYLEELSFNLESILGEFKGSQSVSEELLEDILDVFNL